MTQPPASIPASAAYGEESGLHTHPVPPVVRWSLLAFSLAVTVLLILGVSIYLAGQRRDASQVERVRQQVFAEIDRRTAMRDAQQAQTEAQTRRYVCAVLADIPPSPRVDALAIQLQCPAGR